jgi:hypothetical protein
MGLRSICFLLALVLVNSRAEPAECLANAGFEDGVQPIPQAVREDAPPVYPTPHRFQTNHWAFIPPQHPVPPSPGEDDWSQSPLDTFVLATLRRHQLDPAPPADKRTLIRRATFGLIGLPPSPEEVDAFLQDNSPDAFAKVVDRLLSSPHYGERWGRHWLDVARYADSNGQDENRTMANAFRYRDYVVQSFNEDKPFDIFIREQLAGDLLPTPASPEVTFSRRTATGFLVLGPKLLAEQDKPKLLMDIVDEQIDVVTRAFLGLTVSCARCHDHKFDPVSARDYYALAGIFKSTRTMEHLNFESKWHERPLAPAEKVAASEAHKKELDQVQASLDKLVKEAGQSLKETLKNGEELPNDPRPLHPAAIRDQLAVLELEKERLVKSAPPEIPLALAVEEGEITDLPVHIRGSHLSLEADPVPRGFLEVITSVPPAAIPPDESGRRQLADWLSHPEHPLTSRVIVNRIWQGHFGEGLVRSPDNFGLTGELPSHPELLDWLAREFIRQGGSLKQLHRLMLLSSTYQMSSQWNSEAAALDPGNRLLWRMNRQRLPAEPVRDALLVLGGALDPAVGGSLLTLQNYAYARTSGDFNRVFSSPRRSIYLPVIRSTIYDLFGIFDYPDAALPMPQRPATVVPHQALFFLNSPLVLEHSEKFAQRLLARTDLDDAGRIRQAYLEAFARPVRAEEFEESVLFLDQLQSLASNSLAPAKEARQKVWQHFCQTLLAASEFIYVN